MVKGAVERGVAARGAARSSTQVARMAERHRATCRCSPAPTASRPPRRRSARSSPCSPTGCSRQLRRIADAEYLGKLNGATGTFARPRRRRARAPTGRAVSPLVRRGPRPDLEPADHPDREPRLAGRAVRRRRAVQPGPAQPLHRRLDLHLARLLRPGPRPGHGRLLARCRTRSTRSGSRTPRPTSRSRYAPARRARLDPGHLPLQRDLTDSSMQRNIGTAFGHSLLAIDNVAAGLAGLERRPDGAGRRPRRQLGGARRGGPVGDARRGHPASPAWRTRTSGSRS